VTDAGASPAVATGVDPTLRGKVALVTAASEGLGLACALGLAAAGCRVAICGRRPDVLARAAGEIQDRTGVEVYAVPADLARADQVEACVAQALRRFARIDVLVVNSGHIAYGGLDELDDDRWYEAFDLIVMSAVRLCRRIVPLMRAQGAGDIVFITSAVVREPSPHLLLSNVTRVGVAALAKSLSRTLAPHNVRVNTIAPGYFDTGRVRRRIDELVQRDGTSREAAARQIAGDVPLGRIGTAEELAELVVFVASRRSAYLTGATIQIDGGHSRSLL
jgi:3-oxoacyl-[acyl-carrier protein] reductase